MDPIQLIVEAITGKFDSAIDGSTKKLETFERSGTSALEAVHESMERLEGSTKEFSGLFGELTEAWAGGQIVEWMKGFAEAAADDQARLEALNDALANSGQFSADASEGLEKFARQLALSSGYAIPQVLQGLSTFINMGASVDQAQKLMAISADVAAEKHMSLAQVQGFLARAIQSGSVQALTRLGLTYKDVNLKTATMTEAVTKLGDKFAGDAAKHAQTYEGELSRLDTALDELKSSIGTGILPALTSLANSTLTAYDELRRLSPEARQLIAVVGGLAGGLLTLSLVLPIIAKGVEVIGSSFVNVGGAIRSLFVMEAAGEAAAHGEEHAAEAGVGAEAAFAAVGGAAEEALPGVNALAASFERLRAAMLGIGPEAEADAAGMAEAGAAAETAGSAVADGADVAAAGVTAAETTNPVGWILLIVTALVGLAVAAATHWATVSAWFQRGVAAARSTCTQIGAFFLGLGSDLTKIIDGIILIFTGVPNYLVRMVKEIQSEAQFFVAVWQQTAKDLAAEVNAIIGFFQSLWSGLDKIFGGLGDDIASFVKTAVGWLSYLGQVVVNLLPAQIRDGLNQVVSGFESASARIHAAAGKVGGAISSGLKTGLVDVKAAVGAVGDYLKNALTVKPFESSATPPSVPGLGDLDQFGRPGKSGGGHKSGDKTAEKNESDKIAKLKSLFADELAAIKDHIDHLKGYMDQLDAERDEIMAHVGDQGPTKDQSAALDAISAKKMAILEQERRAYRAQADEQMHAMKALATERARIAGNKSMSAQVRELTTAIREQMLAIQQSTNEAIRANVAKAQLAEDDRKRAQEAVRELEERRQKLEELIAAQAALGATIREGQVADARSARRETSTTQAADDRIQDAQAELDRANADEEVARQTMIAAQNTARFDDAQKAYIETVTKATEAQDKLTQAENDRAKLNYTSNPLRDFGQKLQTAIPEINTFVTALKNAQSGGINPFLAVFEQLVENSKAFADIVKIGTNLFAILGQIIDAFLLPVVQVVAKVLTFFANGIISIYNLFAELVSVLGIHIERLKYVNSLLGDLGDNAKPLIDVTHDLPTLGEYGANSWGPLTTGDSSGGDSLFQAVQTQTTDQGSWFGRLIEIGVAFLAIDWLTHGKFLSSMGGFVQNILGALKGEAGSLLEVVGGVGLLTTHTSGMLGWLEKIAGILLIIQGLFGVLGGGGGLVGGGLSGITGLLSSGGGILKSIGSLFGGGGSSPIDIGVGSLDDGSGGADPIDIGVGSLDDSGDDAGDIGDVGDIGGGGGGTAGTTSAAGSATSGASGASSLLGGLETAGAGIGGNILGSLLNKMLGGNTTDGSVGGTLLSTAGGVVGSIFGGPVGGIIGAGLGGLLGNVVGGLFGPHETAAETPDQSDSSYHNVMDDWNGDGGTVQSTYDTASGGTSLGSIIEQWANSEQGQSGLSSSVQQAVQQVIGLENGNSDADLHNENLHQGTLTLADGASVPWTELKSIVETYASNSSSSGSGSSTGQDSGLTENQLLNAVLGSMGVTSANSGLGLLAPGVATDPSTGITSGVSALTTGASSETTATLTQALQLATTAVTNLTSQLSQRTSGSVGAGSTRDDGWVRRMEAAAQKISDSATATKVAIEQTFSVTGANGAGLASNLARQTSIFTRTQKYSR